MKPNKAKLTKAQHDFVDHMGQQTVVGTIGALIAVQRRDVGA